MCTPKSAKTCSMVTIVFAFLTLLGMIIGAAVFSSMFGPNLQCYVDAVDATINNALTSPSPPPPDGRRLFGDMNDIAAQHTVAQRPTGMALGLYKMVHALNPARAHGRKMDTGDPPNTDSCYGNNNDGSCDDGGVGAWNSLCDCGTDVSDCFYRSADRSDCSLSSSRDQRTDTAAARKRVENDVLAVMNPLIIIPGIVVFAFLVLAAALTLKSNKSCAGLVFYIFGEITGFGAFIVYAIVTYWFIIAAAFVVDVFKSAFPGASQKCVDDTTAMLVTTGVGTLIAAVGCLGGFISGICAACGICKNQSKKVDPS